jgi:hypothetical protein
MDTLKETFNMHYKLSTAHLQTTCPIEDDYSHPTAAGFAINQHTRTAKIFHFRKRIKSNNKLRERIYKMIRKSPHRDPTASYAIVDSGATVSVTPCRDLLRDFKHIQDSAVNIEGIVAAASLKVSGAGRFATTVPDIRALYAPQASESILSWFDLKRYYKITLMRQDHADEHLRLQHKKSRTILRAYIHPEIGLYALPIIQPPVAPTNSTQPSTPKIYNAQPTNSQHKSTSTSTPTPTINPCHCHNKIFSLRDKIQLEKAGYSKISAARIARLQDIHEAYSFCGTSAMRNLLSQHRFQKSDPDINITDWSNWVKYHCANCHPCAAGKTLRPDQISSEARHSDTPGERVHIDLFYIKSDIEEGNLTVLIAVDEASGHISTSVLPDKTSKSILAALTVIKDTYAAGRAHIKEFRSDNEPCLTAAFLQIKNKLGCNLSHVEEYRHTTRAERSIRKIIDPFVATIHSSIPIPAFLYPQLLAYVTDSVNNTFNTNNSSKTPTEQINSNTIIDYAQRASTKFGQLVRVHNPKPTSTSYYNNHGPTTSSHTEASTCVYGIVTGHDPTRKHCAQVYSFVDGGTISRATYTPMDWSDGLFSTYIQRIQHSISKHRPVFLEHSQIPLPDPFPDTLLMPTGQIDSTTTDDSSSETNNTDEETPGTLDDDKDDSDSDLDSDISDDEYDDTWEDLFRPPPNTFTKPTDNNTFLDHDPDSAIMPDNHEPDTIHPPCIASPSLAERVRSRSNRRTRILMSINKAIKQGFPTTKIDTAVNNEFAQMFGESSKDVWDFLTPAVLRELHQSHSIKNIIPSSLFLKHKEQLDILKARLIVHGDKQLIDEIFENHSSPTISVNILFLILSLCAKHDLEFETIDIAGAYLNAALPEPEYMLIPKDLAAILVRNNSELAQYLSDTGTMTVRLKKALYGLKTSGKLWYETINPVLLQLGYTRSNIDKCLFSHRDGDKITYLLLYVDDILIAGNDPIFRTHTINSIESRFDKISRQPVNDVVFLGMHIQKCSNGDIQVDQRSYITDMLIEHNIYSTSTCPATVNINNDHSSDSIPSTDPKAFRSLNMQLMYAATRTRPDILFATSLLATRSHEPTKTDHDRLTKILEYLHGTQTQLLTFARAGPLNPHAYVDASFGLHWDAKGQTGFTIKPCKNSAGILNKCIKQKSVADSSTEAELLALHEAVKHIGWIADIYSELGFDVTPIDVYQDNKSAITICSHEVINYKGRSKFFNRKLFGIHEVVENNTIQLIHIGTEEMVADVLTKALAGNRFRKFSISLMGLDSNL